MSISSSRRKSSDCPKYAKENGLWLKMEEVFDLGAPGPSGNENDTYVADDSIYKVNNLLNCGSILRLLDKVKMHNEIFPDYRVIHYSN